MKKIGFCQLLWFSSFAWFAGCLSTAEFDRRQLLRMDRGTQAILASEALLGAQIGLLVKAVDSGAAVYAIDAGQQMTPASTIKLFTAAACLLAFSPEHRFETRLIPTVELRDGILDGDLFVVSDGDPTLRAEFAVPAEIFKTWAGRMRSAGLRHVRGNLVGVDMPDGLHRYGAGWALDDVPWRYAAPVSRLQINGNGIALELIPAAESADPPTCRLSPASAGRRIVCDLHSGDEQRIVVDWQPLSSGIAISGTLPAGGETVERIVAPSAPAEVYLAHLHEILRAEGLKVDGSPVVANQLAPVHAAPLLVHASPPLREILAVMLKQSDNLIAETLVRALGEKATGEFSFAAGRGAARGVLLPLGVDLERLRYADGSGLSRYNHASAEQLVNLLLAMSRGGRRLADSWRELLPVAARQGTLADRFVDTPLAGNLHAKTGTMSSVRCLSGYFAGASGRNYAFAIMVNGHRASAREVDQAVEKILVGLHRHL